MIFSPTIRNDYEKNVVKQRQQEQKIDSYNQFLKRDSLTRIHHQFDNVSPKQMYLTPLPSNHKKQEKLHQLYEQELFQYNDELSKNVSKQRSLQEIVSVVNNIKQNRESNRRNYVDHQLERQFKQNDDGMRNLRFEQNQILATKIQQNQMIENQTRMVKSFEDELVYAELDKRDRLKKERDNAQRLNHLRNLQLENAQVINVQRRMASEKHQQQEALKRQEQQMLNQAWQIEREDLTKSVLIQRKQELERAEDLQKNYSQILQSKKRAAQDEKLNDQIFIQQIMEKEKLQEQLEKQYLSQQKTQIKNSLKQAEQRKDYFEKQDLLRDQLIKQQNENQWKIKQQQWKEEDDKRVEQIQNVYASRADQLVRIKTRKEQEKSQKLQELTDMNRRVETFNEELNHKRQTRRQTLLNNQSEILRSISEKNQKLRVEAVELERQLQKEQQLNQEYQQKILQEQLRKKELMMDLRNFQSI